LAKIGGRFAGGLSLTFASAKVIHPSFLYTLSLRGYQLSVYVRARTGFHSERYRDQEHNQGGEESDVIRPEPFRWLSPRVWEDSGNSQRQVEQSNQTGLVRRVPRVSDFFS